MNWIPTHVHSHWSLLDGLSKPEDIVEKCAQLEYKACALTDHGTISGCVKFYQECKKKDIKPLLGSELYLSAQDSTIKDSSNRSLSHLVVISKNLSGWKNLMKTISLSNRPENYYYRPRIDLSKINGDDLIAFSGHPGSDLANVLFTDIKAAYRSKSFDEAKSFLHSDWAARATEKLFQYLDIFGDDFFIEIQTIDAENVPAAGVIAKALRWLAKKHNIKSIATADSHYVNKEDADDQRLILCTSMETTFREVNRKLSMQEDVGLGTFFVSRNYHLPSLPELSEHTDEELQNTAELADRVENYDILNNPKLPKFACPNGLSEIEYLRSLCRTGWKDKIIPRVSNDKQQEYIDRAKYELGVIEEFGLSGYFLMVQDYIEYGSQFGIRSPGRGSVGGSLVAYLSGITGVDPIKHGLIFSRFINEGRLSKDHISLPDIDTDFAIGVREKVINYIISKYGSDKVAHVATFGSMKGRGAIKDVLRVHEACSYDEMNRITEGIPDEGKISDQLQEMEEAGEDASIIMWALENNSKKLEEWCYLDDDGKLQGPYSKLFAQAIRLEGTKRNIGQHAAAVVVSSEPLENECPMIYNKEKVIAGMEYVDLEAMGLVKFDILGIAVLDKLQGVKNLLDGKRINGTG